MTILKKSWPKSATSSFFKGLKNSCYLSILIKNSRLNQKKCSTNFFQKISYNFFLVNYDCSKQKNLEFIFFKSWITENFFLDILKFSGQKFIEYDSTFLWVWTFVWACFFRNQIKITYFDVLYGSSINSRSNCNKIKNKYEFQEENPKEF
mgnify:CR=1 FL=1